MGRTNHPPFSRAGRRICADLQVRETIEEERDRHPPERLCSGKSRRDSGGQNSKGGGGRHEKIGIVDGDMRCTRWQAGGHTYSVLRYYWVFRVSMGVWGLMYVAWWWEAG